MLRAGTDTGSLVNHLYSRAVKGQPPAEVGMGATILGWSDRYAATIIKVDGDGLSAGTLITVQYDESKVVKGSTMDGSAEYEYSPNPQGATSVYRLSKAGFWDSVTFNLETKRWNKTGSKGVRIGDRQEYRDPHF